MSEIYVKLQIVLPELIEIILSTEVVENAKSGNFAENDDKLACFSSCMLKKIGIVSEKIV